MRPAYDDALARLRPDDVLVEMMRAADSLRHDGVRFQSLTEHFDRCAAYVRFSLQMHGAMAEYFLNLKCERTMGGLEAALKLGRKGGRPKTLTDADIAAACAMLKDSTVAVADIADRLSRSRIAFYRYFSASRSSGGQV